MAPHFDSVHGPEVLRRVEVSYEVTIRAIVRAQMSVNGAGASGIRLVAPGCAALRPLTARQVRLLLAP